MPLPDLNDCSFFKKSTIAAGDRTERVMIYRLKTDPIFTFEFTCPSCGLKNALKAEMNLKKLRENGKNKEYIVFSCAKCSNEFKIEKFKARARKTKG